MAPILSPRSSVLVPESLQISNFGFDLNVSRDSDGDATPETQRLFYQLLDFLILFSALIAVFVSLIEYILWVGFIQLR